MAGSNRAGAAQQLLLNHIFYRSLFLQYTPPPAALTRTPSALGTRPTLHPTAAFPLKRVVPDRQRRREDAADQEGLGCALVLDVVVDGVGDKVDALEGHLRDDEAEEDTGVHRLADDVQVRGLWGRWG